MGYIDLLVLVRRRWRDWAGVESHDNGCDVRIACVLGAEIH